MRLRLLAIISTLFLMADCQQKEVTPKPVAKFSYQPLSCCLGQYVFKNESTNATRYEWSFGNGERSSADNPSPYYGRNGSYSVTLVAYGADGSQDTRVRQISVENAPYKGNAMFWTNTNVGSAIEVTITYPGAGNIVGIITKYLSSGSPDCNQDGFFTVSLPEGTYNYTAKSSRYTWEGTFSTVVGQCSSKKLVL